MKRNPHIPLLLAATFVVLPLIRHDARGQERTAATQRVVFGVEVRRQIAADSARTDVKYQGSGRKQEPEKAGQQRGATPGARENPQQAESTKTREAE